MIKVNLTYLIDDDYISTWLSNQFILMNNSFVDLMVFENGQLALDQLMKNLNQKNTQPNLILLDLNMPEMDGWEFLDEVSKVNELQQLNIIILTSSDDINDKKRSKDYAFVRGFITKPLDENKINDILNLYQPLHA